MTHLWDWPWEIPKTEFLADPFWDGGLGMELHGKPYQTEAEKGVEICSWVIFVTIARKSFMSQM